MKVTALPTVRPAYQRLLVPAIFGFLGYTAVMVRLDAELRNTGGPGIIAFELAGTADRAERMMELWGSQGRLLAHRSMRLDFGYILSYGFLLALVLDRARRPLAHRPTAMWAAAIAVAGDAVEGVSLLRVLRGSDVERNAGRARDAAIIKFAALAVGLGYAALGAVTSRRHRRGLEGAT